jgi:hypothetical protein
MLRGHNPTVIEEFEGYWKRGDPDSVPLDHFSDCNNVAFIESGFETRPGLDTLIAKDKVLRMYNYKTQDKEGLLILAEGGSIYHSLVDGSDVTYGPVLTISGMTDFAFHAYNGRAYISPFTTHIDLLGQEYQKGLENEYLYVYKGDGSPARRAGGFPPSLGDGKESFKAVNSRYDGIVSKGVHLFAVTDQSNNLLTKVFPIVYAPGNKEIELFDIPTGIGITARNIIMTKAIDPKDYVPDQVVYQYYQALLINDNVTKNARLSVADSDLTSAVTLGTIPPSEALHAEASNTDGFADLGFHLFGVVYETDTGYLTAPGPENFASFNVVDIKKAIHIFNIPVSPDTYVVKRHIVATKAITNYNGDQRGYQFFFVPEATLDNNTATELTTSFYDLDLLDDASHLIDNFAEIPAGAVLNTYKSRMVLTTTFEDISLVYLSAPGEPEAFDQVDGLVVVPLDGTPITNAQEYRDVLYLTKKTRTFASIDNGQNPSEWPSPQPLDQGIGASIHGIAKVLDSDGVNVDFILVCDYSGLMVFNGAYARPELSWKIQDFWYAIPRNHFSNLQISNDSLSQVLYITLPDNRLLIGDYKRGLDPKNIRWGIWSFDTDIQSIALIQTNVLAIGSRYAPSLT